jgi:hypothetical protein
MERFEARMLQEEEEEEIKGGNGANTKTSPRHAPSLKPTRGTNKPSEQESTSVLGWGGMW